MEDETEAGRTDHLAEALARVASAQLEVARIVESQTTAWRDHDARIGGLEARQPSRVVERVLLILLLSVAIAVLGVATYLAFEAHVLVSSIVMRLFR